MIWLALVAALGFSGSVLALGGWAAFFVVRKDGGPESRVTGFWLIEWKGLFSVALLRFDPGSRESFHSHAFNSISWVIGPGRLWEDNLGGGVNVYRRSWWPVMTYRHTFHRVLSGGRTWVMTFRGPWKSDWMEYSPAGGLYQKLTHGRRVIGVARV